MSTANKLSYLNDTKSLLRTSLNKFGSNILTTDTFRSYDTKLNDIYDKLPKVTGSGSEFTLTPVQNGQVDDFKMLGVDLIQDGEPSPDYPQEIKVVEGRQVITDKGKNLFDKDNANILTGFLADGGTFNSTTGYKTLYISCNNSSTYTIQKTSGSFFRVAEFENIPANGDNWITRTKDDNANVITFTTTTGNYLAVTYFKSSDTVTEQEMLNSIQIEEGSTATNYEPYYEPVSYNIDLSLENIQLAKMPNTTYKNKIYKNNGNWYYEENVKKYIIDGTESWTTQSAYSGYYRYMFVLMENYKNDNLSYGVVGMNSHFIQRINQPHGDYEYLYLQAANNNLLSVYIKIKNLSTIANFKTWLSENNVVVWYVLANPVTTQITNTTLIDQLEAISVHTGTNIITISNSNNIIPEIEMTRLKELEKLA